MVQTDLMTEKGMIDMPRCVIVYISKLYVLVYSSRLHLFLSRS